MQGSDDGDGFFGDPAVDDSVAASFGRFAVEADDHVMPRRVGRQPTTSVGLGYGSEWVWLWTTPLISQPWSSASNSACR